MFSYGGSSYSKAAKLTGRPKKACLFWLWLNFAVYGPFQSPVVGLFWVDEPYLMVFQTVSQGSLLERSAP